MMKDFDPCDLTNYQHPPCMFVLWWTFLILNPIVSAVTEWCNSESAPRQERPPPPPQEEAPPPAEEAPAEGEDEEEEEEG